MASVHRVDTRAAMAAADVLRESTSSADDSRVALRLLGEEIGKHVRDMRSTISTGHGTGNRLSVVITTKNDAPTFGRGLTTALESAELGFMNFEGRRGLSALDAPVREIQLPAIQRQVVDTIVVAKSVLATGCTAISLSKTAIHESMPHALVIATIFYSLSGLRELQDAFPNSHIFVVGDPYPLREDGMLDLVIALPDEHI